MELFGLLVKSLFEIALERAEVHRLEDDVVVVRDVKLDGINRLEENPGILVLPKLLDNAVGHLPPVVVHGFVLKMRLKLDLGASLRDVEVRVENLKAGDKFNDFILVQRHMSARFLVEAAKNIAFELFRRMDLLLYDLLDRCGCRFFFVRRGLLWLLLAQFLVISGSEVQEQVLDLLFGSAMGLDVRSHLLLVLVVWICASLEKEFTHFEVVLFDGVIQWRLLVLIYIVRVSSILNHEVGSIQVALFGNVEERSLAIGIDVVDVAAVVYQELDQAALSFASCVVKRRLLQKVNVIDLAALVKQVLQHVQSLLFVFYYHCPEHSSLVVGEVVELIKSNLHL